MRSLLQKCAIGLFFLLSYSSILAAISDTTPILALSDIHFDPFYHCHTQIGCSMIKKLRLAPIKQWDTILGKYTNNDISSPYGSDTNYPLLLSSLNAVQQQSAKDHIEYAILTGDLLAHEYEKKYMLYFLSSKGYSDFVNKTIYYLFYKLQTALPKTTLLYAVGNNDSDKGDYTAEPHAAFFNHLSETLINLLPEKNRVKFKKQFSYGGFYDIKFNDNLTLIVLNSTFFSMHRQGRDVEEGANVQYKWLKKTLIQLKAHHQHAIIVMHIPLAINIYASLGNQSEYFFKNDEHKRLLHLLNTYHDTLRGIITGHVHADTFFLYGNKNLHLMQTGVPSISPIFGTNPSFKVYQLDMKTPEIRDYQTHYLTAHLRSHLWMQGYTFNQTYQGGCEDCSLWQGMRQLHEDSPLSTLYRHYYHSNSPDYIIKISDWPAYQCGLYAETIENYQQCFHTNKKKRVSRSATGTNKT